MCVFLDRMELVTDFLQAINGTFQSCKGDNQQGVSKISSLLCQVDVLASAQRQRPAHSGQQPVHDLRKSRSLLANAHADDP